MQQNQAQSSNEFKEAIERVGMVGVGQPDGASNENADAMSA